MVSLDFVVAPASLFWHPPGAFPGGGAMNTPIPLIRNIIFGSSGWVFPADLVNRMEHE
jgi:hypothetical protein